MKYVKMLGLAAVAAGTLMAFAGASTVTASVYCKTSVTSGCVSSGWAYPELTTFDWSAMETSTIEVGATVLDSCSNSTLHDLVDNIGSTTSTVENSTGVLNWEGCTRTTNTLAQGKLATHWISGSDNGTVTMKGTEWTIGTIFGSCVYGFREIPGDLGTLAGGSPAKLSIKANIPKISGPCPGTAAVWTATYTPTQPDPLFVSTN